MSKNKEQILKEFDKCPVPYHGGDECCLEGYKGELKKKISKALSKTQRATIEEIERKINKAIRGDEDKVLAVAKVFRILSKLKKEGE